MRHLPCILACSIALASCRIEPTPQHYIDAQTTPADRLTSAEEDIADRLRALLAAARTGSVAAASVALPPHANMRVIGPGLNRPAETMAEVLTALRSTMGDRPIDPMRIEVTVDPGLTIAWFDVEFIAGTNDEETLARMSGVAVRETGEWHLVQGHISRAVTATEP